MSEKPMTKAPNRFKPVVGKSMMTFLKHNGMDEDDYILEPDFEEYLPITDTPIPLSDKSIEAALTELLRLYDWRNELAATAKKHSSVDQRKELLIYGREKKTAWETARTVLAAEKSQGREWPRQGLWNSNWMAIEAELASEISYLGEIGNTCTYPMLQKVCNGCKCHRAAMGKK